MQSTGTCTGTWTFSTGNGTGTCNKVLVSKKKITIKHYIFEMQQIASTIRSRLGVLETWVLVSRRLETRFYKSWSRSWSWNLRVLVLVLVLEPSSLGLGRSWDSDAFKELHPLLKVFCLPVTSAPVERIFSHSRRGARRWQSRFCRVRRWLDSGVTKDVDWLYG